MAYPQDPLGVETVDRLVQDEDRRIAEEGGGDAESLASSVQDPEFSCLADATTASQRGSTKGAYLNGGIRLKRSRGIQLCA